MKGGFINMTNSPNYSKLSEEEKKALSKTGGKMGMYAAILHEMQYQSKDRNEFYDNAFQALM